MTAFPIQYIEPVFRPPSEARSLILPVTNGCSWNQCTFCEMYTQSQKQFRARKDEEIQADIHRAARQLGPVRRVFLADGDAMILSTRRLLQILGWLKAAFPDLERISSYCLPRNLKRKSVEELTELRAHGLEMLYIGVESGDDTVLGLVKKGETAASEIDALQRIHQAGMTSSVMILNGLGGRKYSEQHAIASAHVVNETQPHYVSTLVVSFPQGMARFQAGFPDFEPLNQQELFQEVGLFLEHTRLENSLFRSDHASNYLVLRGELNRDRDRLLNEVKMALEQPGVMPLRQEWQRGL
ncbi:MAG: radical SAM protein [Halomonadaceae bacterium]|nr:MAG: radical SAM protein [Halomonadaceae bacterium]